MTTEEKLNFMFIDISCQVAPRSVDFIKTPEGKLLHGINFDYLPKYFLEEIRQFQIVQHDLHAITVTVVKDAGFNDATLSRFEKKLREIVGEAISLRFVLQDSIPREKTGKTRFVATLLPKT